MVAPQLLFPSARARKKYTFFFFLTVASSFGSQFHLLCSAPESRGNLFGDSIICVQVDILFCAESVKTTPRPMLSGRLKFLISKFNWTKTINFPRRCCTTFSNIYRTSTKRGAAIVTTERKSFYLWNRCSRHRNTKALTGVCFHWILQHCRHLWARQAAAWLILVNKTLSCWCFCSASV